MTDIHGSRHRVAWGRRTVHLILSGGFPETEASPMSLRSQEGSGRAAGMPLSYTDSRLTVCWLAKIMLIFVLTFDADLRLRLLILS